MRSGLLEVQMRGACQITNYRIVQASKEGVLKYYHKSPHPNGTHPAIFSRAIVINQTILQVIKYMPDFRRVWYELWHRVCNKLQNLPAAKRIIQQTQQGAAKVDLR